MAFHRGAMARAKRKHAAQAKTTKKGDQAHRTKQRELRTFTVEEKKQKQR